MRRPRVNILRIARELAGPWRFLGRSVTAEILAGRSAAFFGRMERISNESLIFGTESANHASIVHVEFHGFNFHTIDSGSQDLDGEERGPRVAAVYRE